MLKQLILDGNFSEVHELLEGKISSSEMTSFTLICGRFNRLKKDQLRGTITSENFNIQLNRINHAAFHFIESLPQITVSPSELQKVAGGNSNDSLIDSLMEVRKKNERRNPKLSKQASKLQTKIEEYQKDKKLITGFDPSGRRWAAIKEEAKVFFEKLSEKRKDNLEETVEKVKKLIVKPVPSYKSLKGAYALLVGRGFQNDYIEKNLELQPDDDEIRIRITEEIESGINRLQ